jgi:hypothetical protein
MNYEDLILSAEEGERGRVTILPDGREVHEGQITLSAEGFERLRTGYLCAHCLEDLTSLGAFPEACPTCGFRVAELQLKLLERQYVGEQLLGSSLSLSDELARMEELWLPSR